MSNIAKSTIEPSIKTETIYQKLVYLMANSITRQGVDAFVKQHIRSIKPGMVLNLGSGSRRIFPKTPAGVKEIGLDIIARPTTLALGDSHQLPLKDQTFSAIVAREVLEHFHDPDAAVEEMHRLLINGGKVILTTRFLFPVHDAPHDYFRFTDYGLRYLFRDFSKVQIVAQDHSIVAVAVVLARLALEGPPNLFRAVMNFIVVLFALVLFFSEKIGHIIWPSKNFSSGYFVVAIK
ncbi:MAG: hypothetical protein FOGNACKC_00087 [Anaerolineae bacterium]|nr:hypothetical protein [Anaerolineae bacterium]